MKKRYYPSPSLDKALYYLQNHPEAQTLGAKKLVDTDIAGEIIGRGAWEQAKRLLCKRSEPRTIVTVDLNTGFVGYVGASSRLITRAKSRAALNAKIALLTAAGYRFIFATPDKQFKVYAAPAEEMKVAA